MRLSPVIVTTLNLNTVLSEISQTQTEILQDVTFMCHPKLDSQRRMVVPRAGTEGWTGKGQILEQGHKVSDRRRRFC